MGLELPWWTNFSLQFSLKGLFEFCPVPETQGELCANALVCEWVTSSFENRCIIIGAGMLGPQVTEPHPCPDQTFSSLLRQGLKLQCFDFVPPSKTSCAPHWVQVLYYPGAWSSNVLEFLIKNEKLVTLTWP